MKIDGVLASAIICLINVIAALIIIRLTPDDRPKR
jgi:hypothetical protein